MAHHTTIEEEVAALGGLTLSQLRSRWEALFGSAPPASLRKAFLVKACAYQMQVHACGGLSGSTKRKLRKIAEDLSSGKPVSITPPRRIKPGTRLVRAWGGEVHSVTVTREGFEYAGERYGSLSAIAKTITGSQWNGPAFFGLEGPTRGEHGAKEAGTRGQAASDGGGSVRTGNNGGSAKDLEVVDYE